MLKIIKNIKYYYGSWYAHEWLNFYLCQTRFMSFKLKLCNEHLLCVDDTESINYKIKKK